MSIEKPKPRGRPIGTSPTRAEDDRILARVALHLTMGLGEDFTNSARRIIGDRRDHDAVVKRLQRKWKSRREEFLEKARKVQLDMHWKNDLKALRQNQPELFSIVETFARSAKGQEILRGEGVHSDNYMALGMMRLWELIQGASALGTNQADRFFAKAYADWASTGLDPDEDFLKRIAELALEKARETSDRKAQQQMASQEEIGK
ncbi:MAG: hypothetical protein M9924_11365 [Rhizobiaceae bacterium]|nr:hypothetical protein [Rhizobiaceae bacterium]